MYACEVLRGLRGSTDVLGVLLELLTCEGTAERPSEVLEVLAPLIPGRLLLASSELSTLPFEDFDNHRHTRGPLFQDTNIPQV